MSCNPKSSWQLFNIKMSMLKNNYRFLWSFILGVISGCTSPSGDGVLLSPSGQERPEDKEWKTEYWSPEQHYSDIRSDGSDTRILMIASDTLTADRWYRSVAVKPFSEYRISGYIKTENVRGENENAGAGFRLGAIAMEKDTLFRKDNDWTFVEIPFKTGANDAVMIECLLGKSGKASGIVYFDRMRIEEVSSSDLKPRVKISLDSIREPMSPYLYGQFIEHMGKCIYGGIWAEMLRDRKFYHAPGAKRSPWQTNVDTTTILTDSTKNYSRGNMPVLGTSSGKIVLTQDSLVLEKGEKYVGRIVFKAEQGVTKMEVSLGTEEENKEERISEITRGRFVKVPLEFTPVSSSENGKLGITFYGKGKVTLAAVSLMPEDNIDGFRPDVLELMKELNAPVYRWPGGNFVSGYDWKDGIGDPDTRPTRYERAWNGLEYNDVGIHEFMRLCKLLGAEANIAVNTGLGTVVMAAEEVEYFNGDVSTGMGKRRAENGHPEPYDVKLWAVGNEMFGDWQLGHMPVEDYVKKHNKVARAMREVDPDIELIAVGFPGEWNDMMYSHCSENMTYISEHFYRQDWHAGGLLTHVRQIPDAIREIADEHRRCREEFPRLKNKEIKIALDEWNYWYGPHVYGLLGTRYYLRDALGIAAGFNEFSRQSDIFYMANYAQTVNVIGAIKTTKTDSWLEGTGLALKLYREHFGTRPLTVKGVPQPLDVAATLSEDGKFLTVSVINATHNNYPLILNIEGQQIESGGRQFSLTGENDMAYNDENNRERIRIVQNNITLENNSITIPRESANIYVFPLVKK